MTDAEINAMTDDADAAADDADGNIDAKYATADGADVTTIDVDEAAIDAEDIITEMFSEHDAVFMLWSRDELFLRARDTVAIGR